MTKQKTLDLTGIKAVLIDLDGTLANSMPLLFSTYMHFLKHNGYAGTKEEFNSLIGAPLGDIVGALKRKYHFDQSANELMQFYMKMLIKHYSEELELFPGAEEFLRYAQSLNLKLALVTSAPKDLVHRFLIHKKLINAFDLIMTPESVSMGKPSPEIFQKTLSELQLKPENAVVIEDSSHGVKAAVDAKIPTIKLTHGDEQHPEKYCILLKDWHEVLYLFQSRGS